MTPNVVRKTTRVVSEGEKTSWFAAGKRPLAAASRSKEKKQATAAATSELRTADRLARDRAVGLDRSRVAIQRLTGGELR